MRIVYGKKTGVSQKKFTNELNIRLPPQELTKKPVLVVAMHGYSRK